MRMLSPVRAWAAVIASSTAAWYGVQQRAYARLHLGDRQQPVVDRHAVVRFFQTRPLPSRTFDSTRGSVSIGSRPGAVEHVDVDLALAAVGVQVRCAGTAPRSRPMPSDGANA
jgi:hypothetical protein